MGNNLVLGWPKPIWFMVLGAHGSWWFQPIWKKYSSQGFAEDRVKRKILWNHHFLLIASVSAKTGWLGSEGIKLYMVYDPGWNFLHSHIPNFQHTLRAGASPTRSQPHKCQLFTYPKDPYMVYLPIHLPTFIIYIHIYIYIYTVNISLSTKSILNIQIVPWNPLWDFFDSPSSCLNFVLAIRNDTISSPPLWSHKIAFGHNPCRDVPSNRTWDPRITEFLGTYFSTQSKGYTPEKLTSQSKKPHF